jgi:pimeloyl-ACP methyl ester carboxylesterase
MSEDPAVGPVVVQTEVSEVVQLRGPLHTVASVFLPDPAAMPLLPVVVFAFPGGGYSRGYFSFDLPGSEGGGQAGYHASRHGWIVVTCDHLGVGESSLPDPASLTLENITAANAATVSHVLILLRTGSLAAGFPAADDFVCLGVGQSMGGCFTILLQDQAAPFDGVAILGYSAIAPTVPVRGGRASTIGSDLLERADAVAVQSAISDLRYAFHYEDVPEVIVEQDLSDFPARHGQLPAWASATIPPCSTAMARAGIVTKEAAAIDVPVLIAVGEIDAVPDLRVEPAAYANSSDITAFWCPRMAHMHNFAGTRTRLWDRIGSWGRSVGALRR